MEPSISSLSENDISRKPFRFFDLPLELRRKILGMVLLTDRTIDLDYLNHRRIAPRLVLFLTSKRIHEEAYPVFYGGHTFRIFPTNISARSKAKPLLARLPPHYRSAMLSLELRLGPGWSKPPKSWDVTDDLGLGDAMEVRKIKVFVECDPSHEIFNGFRVAKDFYTNFSGTMLKDIITRLPVLEQVQFDGYPSVSRNAPLMMRLMEEVKNGQKRITWGPGMTEKISLV
ncbi:hypothetical protein MMC24_006692 [Lignoscripta atroalba]|nr:hypothetical protein [Lignoscripta atroalba]